MDNEEVKGNAPKCIKPTLPSISAAPPGIHSPIEVETVKEDEDYKEDNRSAASKPLIEVKTTPAEPASDMHSPMEVETFEKNEDNDELMKPISSKPPIKVTAARKLASKDNESEEQRKTRLERDRLYKQKSR
jgi:hypothetical protein